MTGDILSIVGAFLYAVDNVLQEHYLKKTSDVWNFIAHLGMFGVIVSLLEAWVAGEF